MNTSHDRIIGISRSKKLPQALWHTHNSWVTRVNVDKYITRGEIHCILAIMGCEENK